MECNISKIFSMVHGYINEYIVRNMVKSSNSINKTRVMVYNTVHTLLPLSQPLVDGSVTLVMTVT